eukprot:4161613-Pleurochrysis_carterae.AAC.2
MDRGMGHQDRNRTLRCGCFRTTSREEPRSPRRRGQRRRKGGKGGQGPRTCSARLAPEAPTPAPLWFMSPEVGEVFGALGATGARGNSSVAASCMGDSDYGSVSADRMHRARPGASRVNATSPPPCANSALRAVSASDFDSDSDSVVTRAA